MKTNGAPEKIYIPTILAANTVRYKTEGSIEYVRKDAFIKKACEWLSENANEYWGIEFVDSGEMVDDFKKYMEDKV